MRTQLSFRVDDANGRWLQPDGTWGLELSAAQLVMHAEPTVSEDIRIQAALHALAGGAVSWGELLAAHRELSDIVGREVMAGPLGERPELTEDDGSRRPATDAEWQNLVQASHLVWDSTAGDALRRVERMAQRLSFLATWSVLSLEAPPRMRTLEAMDALPPETLDWVERAVNRAQREHDLGKAPSSPS